MKYVSSTLTLLLAAAAAGPAAADLKAPRKNRKLAGKAATNPVDGAPRTQSSTLQKDTVPSYHSRADSAVNGTSRTHPIYLFNYLFLFHQTLLTHPTYYIHTSQQPSISNTFHQINTQSLL